MIEKEIGAQEYSLYPVDPSVLKLTEEQVLQVRQARKNGKLHSWGAMALASSMGVDLSTILRAADGRTWNLLTE